VLLNPFDDRPSHVKTKAAATYAILIAANVASWAWAWVAFSNRPALLGTALLAYVFGLRHAFDADHIAAIDNVVRKLMQDGKRPCSAGFFFSLGHSTIVVLASVLIAIATAALRSKMAVLSDVGGVIGTTVSALFLLIIALANVFILRGVWVAFNRVRHGGTIAPADLDVMLAGQGLLARLFRPLFRLVSQSWRMYPVGVLFGLGFDTATEIGLLGIAATQAAGGMSPWTILVFPALFTAGMSLVDTTDSVLMTGAYGWAFVTPMRKLWYNLTITAASVGIALFIGGVEGLGLIVDKLGLTGGVWRAVSDLGGNLANFGYVVVGLFLVSWIVSALIYRAKGQGRV
jgi:high-affinity nickel-transport protein